MNDLQDRFNETHMKKKLEEMRNHYKLRDPKRIDRILKLIEERWKRSSDLRFFQLLESIFGCQLKRNQCFFAQEDDVTEERLRVA